MPFSFFFLTPKTLIFYDSATLGKDCDVSLRLIAAIKDTHNQAGIGHRGRTVSLLNLLDVKIGFVQRNAAFALYGLGDNEENVVDFREAGGVQKLQDNNFTVQPTKDCVVRTLKRLERRFMDDMVTKMCKSQSNSKKQQKYDSSALFELAKKLHPLH